MDVSAWIGDAASFCRMNPLIAVGILVVLAAIAYFRPKAIVKFVSIALVIFILVYLSSFFGGATSSGVKSKAHMSDQDVDGRDK